MQPGEQIKAARKAADLTQSQAAARCGVSFSALEKWERGAAIAPPTLAGVLLLLGAPARDAAEAGRRAVEAA